MVRVGIKIAILAISVLLLAELGMMAYDRWFAEGAVPDREVYPLRGIDISHHNGEVDFSRVASEEADVAFAYIKATEGTDFIDPAFIRNARLSVASGIPSGAYHFFRYDTDGELQALNFLHAIQGRGFTLPPAIDVEDWGNPDGHTTALIVERLRRMTDCLAAKGYSPLIYTNLDGYHRLIRVISMISLSGFPPSPTLLSMSIPTIYVGRYGNIPIAEISREYPPRPTSMSSIPPILSSIHNRDR